MQETQSNLQSVSSKFAEWRSRKTSSRCRIPKDLWAEAVHLCETYPIGVVRGELGLNGDKLKEKVSRAKENLCQHLSA